MPITIKPADHDANPLTRFSFQDAHAHTAERLLALTNADDLGESKTHIEGLVQTSFPRNAKEFESRGRVLASKNGFVNACIDAYNDHHHLVVRPEDVWVAILTQLSIYVNKNASALRNLFVDHEGKEDLFIEVPNMDKVDHGEIAVMMTKIMSEKLKNREMRDWIMPTFTTTEKIDQAVAAVVFMGTMQKYFTYSWGTRCGIPTVTLEGQIRDWADIHARVKRMTGVFGDGVRGFRDAVLPAVEGIGKGFLDPEGFGRRFWQGVCVKHNPNGSGTPTYTGWITAFAYWAENGRCLHKARSGSSGAPLSTEVHLQRRDVPCAFVRVPVRLFDLNRVVDAGMMAGSLAIMATDEDGGRSKELNTLRPQLGWFLYKT